jgi:hypothetical protein
VGFFLDGCWADSLDVITYTGSVGTPGPLSDSSPVGLNDKLASSFSPRGVADPYKFRVL